MDPILQFFDYRQLPPHLQDVSRPFGELAAQIVEGLPRNPERTVALRKLLESMDCAVRAMVYRTESDDNGGRNAQAVYVLGSEEPVFLPLPMDSAN